MTFSFALRAILGVVLLHVIFVATDAYAFFAPLDIPMHFLGGFVMALLGMAIHHSVIKKHKIKTIPWWYHFLFVLSFSLLIGVAWELYEFIFDHTVNLWFGWFRAQLSLSDTMGDFVMDSLGAIIAFFFFRNRCKS